jgi:hypothetical protein
MIMAKKTQKTPKEHYKIPIPTRGEFECNLKKAAKPKSTPDSPKK